MHNTSTSETYFEKLGCVSNEYYQYELGIELNGVVSSECISNDAIIPGHSDSSTQTIPTKPTICDENQSEIVKYIQGYKYGQILGIDQEDLKLYLTRVSPVVGSIIYLLDDGDTTITGEIVFLGREKVANKQYWIIARQIKEQIYSYSGLQDSYHYQAEEIPFNWPSRAIDSQYFGNLLFKDVYNPIVEPTYCTAASDATVTKD
ncbi:MAG: hypothetical protein EZS28_009430 [Streblomastix strix]|uniref:Uncharacterized protein n=1 Tax=Streblomastix strix TaxID=222440 RepID=A0A5J4WK58_9EUKA|nr:MAG: hypothetical protein EZS28_009430 [Streblomastix strix]